MADHAQRLTERILELVDASREPDGEGLHWEAEALVLAFRAALRAVCGHCEGGGVIGTPLSGGAVKWRACQCSDGAAPPAEEPPPPTRACSACQGTGDGQIEGWRFCHACGGSGEPPAAEEAPEGGPAKSVARLARCPVCHHLDGGTPLIVHDPDRGPFSYKVECLTPGCGVVTGWAGTADGAVYLWNGLVAPHGVEAAPCAFCPGVTVTIVNHDSEAYVRCNRCRARGPVVEEGNTLGVGAAIAAWNRRPASAPPPPAPETGGAEEEPTEGRYYIESSTADTHGEYDVLDGAVCERKCTAPTEEDAAEIAAALNREAARQREGESMREALLGMLRRVEWVEDTGYHQAYCPICTNLEDAGHEDGCELAALLTGTAQPEVGQREGEPSREHPGHCPTDGCFLNRGHVEPCEGEPVAPPEGEPFRVEQLSEDYHLIAWTDKSVAKWSYRTMAEVVATTLNRLFAAWTARSAPAAPVTAAEGAEPVALGYRYECRECDDSGVQATEPRICSVCAGDTGDEGRSP